MIILLLLFVIGVSSNDDATDLGLDQWCLKHCLHLSCLPDHLRDSNNNNNQFIRQGADAVCRFQFVVADQKAESNINKRDPWAFQFEKFNRTLTHKRNLLSDPRFKADYTRELSVWKRAGTRMLDSNDCSRLDSPQYHYRHHTDAVQSGLLSHLPYMDETHCGDSWLDWTTPPEIEYRGVINNVWVLNDGAMMTIDRILFCPNHELHPLHLDALSPSVIVASNNVVVNLRQRWSHNYFHAMLEVLPRLLLLLDVLLSKTNPVELLIGKLPDAVWDLLQAIGIKKSFSSTTAVVFASTVYFSSYSPYRFPSELGRESIFRVKGMLAVIHAAYCGKAKPRNGAGVEVVLAARSPPDDREPSNWNDLVDALKLVHEDIAKIRVVNTLNMTGIAQVCSFAAADVIVGVHGSNLVNILACQQPKVALVELFPPMAMGPRFSFFWHIAGALSFNHYSVLLDKAAEIPISTAVNTVKMAINDILKK